MQIISDNLIILSIFGQIDAESPITILPVFSTGSLIISTNKLNLQYDDLIIPTSNVKYLESIWK